MRIMDKTKIFLKNENGELVLTEIDSSTNPNGIWEDDNGNKVIIPAKSDLSFFAMCAYSGRRHGEAQYSPSEQTMTLIQGTRKLFVMGKRDGMDENEEWEIIKMVCPCSSEPKDF